ncbi:unnamed protein product [Closterium sp. NIES-64]|nr:unnamed protein product [Closterium sp. NIES-64]
MEDVEGAAAMAMEGAAAAVEGTGGMSADVVYVRGEGTDVENVGVEEAHVVGNVVGDAKEEDNAAAPTPTGVETTTGNAGVERRGGAVEAGRQPGSSAAGRQATPAVVAQLRQKNMWLRAENARLETALGVERGRVDRFAMGIGHLVDKLRSLADQNITANMGEAWDAMKAYVERAESWLDDLENPEGFMAVQRANAVVAMGNHMDEARKGLEEYISKHLVAAQTNIATAVTQRVAVPPPTQPAPPPAFPDELMKSFKADVLKAATEATQQSFVASGLNLMTQVIGHLAPGRHGSSPSDNEADKKGAKRAGGGDDALSSKRSKGADGSHGVGQVGPGGSRSKGADGSGGTSVVDQLKKNGAKVIRTHSKGDGIRSAEGGPADQVAAQEAGPTAPPLVAEKPASLATAPTAIDGGAKTVKGPSVGVAGTTSIPRKPPAASSAPVAPSAANNDGPSLAATPAPAGTSAAKVDAVDAAANRAGPSAPKANALREMLSRMETHRQDVQQPPVVGARTAAAPARAQPVSSSCATPTSVTVAAHTLGAATVEAVAEKGVSAALATGGRSVDPAQAAKDHNDADIAAIQDLLEAVNRPKQPPVLAILDSASPTGCTAEPKTTTAAVGAGKSKRKGTVDAGKARPSSKKKTRATSAMVKSVEKGQGMATAMVEKEKEEEMEEKKNEKEEKEKEKEEEEEEKEKEEEEKEKEEEEEKVEEAEVGEEEKEKEKEEEKEEKEEEEKKLEEEEAATEEEKVKVKERKGHGIRHDTTGDKQGWVGEIKVVGNESRYIGKSRDKMELTYLHSIVYLLYDGYVSKILMAELTGLEETVMKQWRAVWKEVRFLPTGMWTVIWARGAFLPKTRFDDILGKYRAYKTSGNAHHDALLPAIWFPVDADTKSDAMMSAMIDRVSMCAAYGMVAASAARMEGDTDQKTAKVAQALSASACALWCLFDGDGAQVADAVREGKAAAMLVGASETTAAEFKKVMTAVLEAAISRKIGIAVPLDAQMEYDIEHRGRKRPRGKQGKDSSGKKGKKGRAGKDSTAA